MDLQADQCKREGNECMKKEKYIEAMLHYTKAIKINDEVPTYYSNRSLAFLKIQQYYYALDDAKKVTQMMPKWTRGYYRKGQVEMETEQFEEAIKTFQMGLDLDPGDPKIKESHEKAKVSWQNQRKSEWGDRVQYKVLDTGETYLVTTYETHPWVFRDADTGDKLVANHEDVFYPVPWRGETRQTIVNIEIPVYSLKERCIQQVRKQKSTEEVKQLDIPKDLIRDIIDKEDVPFGERVYVEA